MFGDTEHPPIASFLVVSREIAVCSSGLVETEDNLTGLITQPVKGTQAVSDRVLSVLSFFTLEPRRVIRRQDSQSP